MTASRAARPRPFKSPRSSICVFALLLSMAAAGCTSSTMADSEQPDVPSGASLVVAAESAGMLRVTFPAESPGIPAYARMGLPSAQLFHDERWLVVPFYRQPDLIRGDFNLLALFDFPGAGGPGAFGVPLVVEGFYMIERDASPTTFPRVALSRGTNVPVWFVSWPTFDAARADGEVTMDELRAMNPVRAVATQFEETLRPRVGEHLVVLDASGQTADGRRFTVHVTHVEERTKALRISLR